jgi:hypothetical protein
MLFMPGIARNYIFLKEAMLLLLLISAPDQAYRQEHRGLPFFYTFL